MANDLLPGWVEPEDEQRTGVRVERSWLDKPLQTYWLVAGVRRFRV